MMLVHSSLFRFFALILGITFLVSFGDNRYVLAVINLGPDERYPAMPGVPDVSDYPDIGEIRRNFLGTRPMGTLVMAVSERYTNNYFEFCRMPQLQKTCIYEAFPADYLRRRGRSERWYAKFYDDCNSAYLEGASGAVYVVTDDGDVPDIRNCRYFEDQEFPILDNERVYAVFLVDARDWTNQRIYRPEGDGGRGNGDGGNGNGGNGNEENGDEGNGNGGNGNGGNGDGGNGNGGNGNGGNGNEAGGNGLSAAGIGTAAAGFVTDLTVGLAGALKQPFKAPVYASHRQDSQEDKQDPRLKPLDPDAKASIMPDSTSPDPYTPPNADDFAIPSTGATPDLGLGTDSTSGSDGLPDYKENLNLQNLFQRRRRALRPRFEGSCRAWLGDPPDAPQPSNPSGTSSGLTPTPPQVDGLIPKLNALSPGIAEIATVLVTQHAKAPPDNRYTLDISILAADGTMINNMVNIEAPPDGGEIEIQIPSGVELGQDAPTVKVPSSPPLYLSVGDNDQDPLKFRYSDYALTSFGQDFGLKFDSNNQNPEHQCVVGAWTDSKRDVKCFFTVVHL